MCHIRKESKGNNTIIFIKLQEFNSKIRAIAIKYKYLFLPLLCTLVYCINKALKPLNS